MNEHEEFVVAGSLRAIHLCLREWLQGRLMTWALLDEVLHALDGLSPVGDSAWRFRFCRWTHKGGS